MKTSLVWLVIGLLLSQFAWAAKKEQEVQEAAKPKGKAAAVISASDRLVPVAPKKPRVTWTASTIAAGKMLTIDPVIPQPVLRGEFVLVQRGKQVFLTFVGRDGWALDRKSTMLVQLSTQFPLELKTTLVLGGDWPKKGSELALPYEWTGNPMDTEVVMRASFKICKQAKCERVKTKWVGMVKPV